MLRRNNAQVKKIQFKFKHYSVFLCSIVSWKCWLNTHMKLVGLNLFFPHLWKIVLTLKNSSSVQIGLPKDFDPIWECKDKGRTNQLFHDYNLPFARKSIGPGAQIIILHICTLFNRINRLFYQLFGVEHAAWTGPGVKGPGLSPPHLVWVRSDFVTVLLSYYFVISMLCAREVSWDLKNPRLVCSILQFVSLSLGKARAVQFQSIASPGSCRHVMLTTIEYCKTAALNVLHQRALHLLMNPVLRLSFVAYYQ